MNAVQVSRYPSVNAVHQGVATSLGDIAMEITSGAHAAKITAVRSAPDKETANAIKKTLPGFTPSGTFRVRNKHALKSHSGCIHADFDDLTSAKLATLRAQLAQDPHCGLCFVSPRGNGLKAFFACDPTRNHKESWQALATYLKDRYGVAPDEQASDLARFCYLSHDPDAFVAAVPVTSIPYPATTAEPSNADKREDYAPLTTRQLQELLTHVPTRPDYETWIKVIGGVAYAVPETVGIPLLKEWSPEEEAGEYAEKWASALTEVTPGTLIYLAKENGWKPSPAFKMNMGQIERLADEERRARIAERLKDCEWGIGPIPEAPTPRFLINGVPICTPGNITSVFAQAKVGKSSFIAALIAAKICAEFAIEGRDCLGVTARESFSPGVLHIDTEQSKFDHYRLIRRALDRAGVGERPSWLRSFRLAGSSPRELVLALRLLCEEEATKGGIFCVIIDGVADLVSDVNEAVECNVLVAELHDLAIRHDCSVIGIMHENPAQVTAKQRGHLGSQLERKAETNLRLKKDGEITTVYADKTRGAPILEKFGPRFQWDEASGMHVSVATAAVTAEEAKIAELRDLAEQCFPDGEPVTYTELKGRVATIRSITTKGAEKPIKAMVKAGVIRKDPGSSYYLLLP